MNENGSPQGNGFSLVEIVMAVIVISFGLLALATTSGYVIGQIQSSRLRTERTVAVQQAIETLHSQPYAALADGSAEFGRFTVEWQVQTVNYALTRVELVSTGPSYGPRGVTTVPDTVRISIIRP
jgi:Tfp pilus assembly protein PilV